FTRERVGARRAEMLGLVTKVVAPADLAKEAEALAQDLLSRSAASLQGIKEYLKFASRMDPGAATAYSSVLNAAVSSSQPRKYANTRNRRRVFARRPARKTRHT